MRDFPTFPRLLWSIFVDIPQFSCASSSLTYSPRVSLAKILCISFVFLTHTLNQPRNNFFFFIIKPCFYFNFTFSLLFCKFVNSPESQCLMHSLMFPRDLHLHIFSCYMHVMWMLLSVLSRHLTYFLRPAASVLRAAQNKKAAIDVR